MKKYADLCDEVYESIGKEEFNRIAKANDEFELCYIKGYPKESFLGFLQVYDEVRSRISESTTIIDFGCCYAAQSHLLKGYRRYIGVDPSIKPEHRFYTANSEHIYETAQSYIADKIAECDTQTVFAICSYVPDDMAMQMVKEHFPNHFIIYPDSKKYAYDFKVTNDALIKH